MIKVYLLKFRNWIKTGPYNSLLQKFFSNKLSKIFCINLLILLVFLVCVYFKKYTQIFLVSFLFLIINLSFSNEIFSNFIKNFFEDQNTIKVHYKKDFLLFHYLLNISRGITVIFYYCFLYIFSASQMVEWEKVFFVITYSFIIITIVDIIITVYIILYKNKPITETVATMTFQIITKAASAMGALHMAAHVPMIEPNVVTNNYHKYSPIGRGYGASSTGQLLQIDYLKTLLGSKFDYKQIIDENQMVDPKLLDDYFHKNNLELKTFDLYKFRPKK